MWPHRWKPFCSSLILDDFGVKFSGKEHAEHLIKALGGYEIEINWEGKNVEELILTLTMRRDKYICQCLDMYQRVAIVPAHDV